MIDILPGALWRELATPVIPAPGSVHLWRVVLARPVVDADWEALAEDERERAGRLLSPEDRRRFVVATAALRRVLGAALGRTPSALAIQRDESGRMRLADGALTFHLARARDQALIALAPQEPVGLELTVAAEVPPRTFRTERVFTDPELRFLAAQAEPSAWIPRLWASKAAILKALGYHPGTTPLRVQVVPAPEGWTVAPASPADGYAGAVAVRQAHGRIFCGTWAASFAQVAEPVAPPAR